MRLAQNAGRGTLVSVTVGIGTLLGLDDRPGELAGYGPIGADVARLLATEGTWRRLLVDEPSGALLDVDRRRYRPPTGIVEHVRLRNRTCVFPTCSVPSASCQMDHTVPFPQGPTSADNLGPLCASHHQLKTHAGYQLEQPAAGSFVVRTPSGHVYLEQPERQPGVPFPGEVSSGLVDGSSAPAASDGPDRQSRPGDLVGPPDDAARNHPPGPVGGPGLDDALGSVEGRGVSDAQGSVGASGPADAPGMADEPDLTDVPGPADPPGSADEPDPTDVPGPTEPPGPTGTRRSPQRPGEGGSAGSRRIWPPPPEVDPPF